MAGSKITLAMLPASMRKGIQYDIFSGFLAELSETGSYRRISAKSCSQACGLRNGQFERQGSIHLPQRSGSRGGDLKKVAVGTSAFYQVLRPLFSVHGNKMLLLMEICERLRYNFDVRSVCQIGILDKCTKVIKCGIKT